MRFLGNFSMSELCEFERLWVDECVNFIRRFNKRVVRLISMGIPRIKFIPKCSGYAFCILF